MTNITECHFCGDPADYLCDAPTKKWLEDEQREVFDGNVCSLPICSRCRTKDGQIFWPGEIDSVDYCPFHSDREVELKAI